MMKLHRVISTVAFGPGTLLALDARQAALRADRVEPVSPTCEGYPERSIVRAIGPQEFKAGELVGVGMPVPKALADRLSDMDDPVAARQAMPGVSLGNKGKPTKKIDGVASKPSRPVASVVPTGPRGLATA